MSRVLGWGSAVPSDLLHSGMHGMRRWLTDVLRAVPIRSNMWRVRVQVHPKSGRIVTVRQGEEQTMSSTNLELVMINYLSVGADAQVVFETEKRRQATPLRNRVMYVVQSTLHTVQLPQAVTSTLDRVHIDGHAVPVDALGSQHCFVVLNVQSYSGGARIWDTASAYDTGHPLHGSAVAPTTTPSQGDGRFEVVTIKSLPQLGWHVGVGTGALGGVRRVAQGAGIAMQFRPGSSIYAQVDGEGYRLEHVVSIQVEPFADAQVLVLPK
mgnify:CR=1 FL=1